MQAARAWLVLAAVAWGARAGPGPPAFDYALYNLSIPENSAPRTLALPPPGAAPPALRLPPGARCRYRIRHGDKDKFFRAEERIVGDLCFLTVRTRTNHAGVLNRERRDHYRLDVRGTLLLPGRTLDADTVLAITIEDENDLSPLFYPTEYEALVPEDAPPHSSIARVTAEDADLGINGEIYYSLAEPTDRFAVHPTSGIVSITRPLAASDGALHTLTVLARDRASLLARSDEAPAARAELRVRVQRVNLHAPELRARTIPVLPENTTGEIYAVIEVTDRDEGEHGRIAGLDIVDGDPDGHFRVRETGRTGEYELLVHALLDRETAPHGYNLTLRASDAGRPPRASYLTLPVTLVDVNDNAPVFSREVYEASLPETAPPNTPVIRLKVTDLDEGANARVYIEIVGGNEGGEFMVNPDTGVLYTAMSLDAEEKSLYTLTVSAIDQGDAGTRKQSSAKVKITVLDSNDNNPVFEQEDMVVEIPENGAAGAVVARVIARDADSGENAYISYSIANLQPVPFEVDHFSGAVRTTRVLDYESMRREYVLRIRASDWGLPYRRQAEMRLTVKVKDVNDNRPQFERVDCVGYLPRRLPAGYEIVTLSAIDFDDGDVVSYRIVSGNEDNCFALDSSTGVLSLSCDLGEVRADSLVLNVTATDGAHFADATALTLHVVAGGAPAALDCRAAGATRRLTDLLAAAERSNAPLDAADDFPLAPSRYGENLHAPDFIDFPVEVKVNESVALGTSLVKLRARDRDLGYNGLLVYGISGGDTDSAFRIDPDTGELQVIGYLDRERESEYYLNVTVYDLGSPQRSASRLLPVTVLDVNDNAPRFEKTLASFRVTENALNGTAIFHANATDRDAGEFGRVTYSLTGADDAVPEFCVERDTGIVRVCAALDRERRALYELAVRATDGGGRSAEARVRVAVDDVNDNAPRFGLAAYGARVREDVPVGTVVAVLEAFDPDLGDGGTLTYSLPDQPSDDVIFTVDGTSGTLRTAKRLDYEERQVYGVTVRATDGGRPALWAEASLVVEVLDVDENAHAPQFADRLALAGTVKEDEPPGAPALAATARDLDPPGRDARLAYYLLAGDGLAHFSIDDQGMIRTLSPLDRETTTHYWLTACAQDHALVPRHTCVQVYIEVEDVNDMAPWPEQASYSAAVPELAPPRTFVARVTAVDADLSPTPTNVSYSIVAGNPDGLFSIDEHTGEIVTTGRTLDREAAAAHALEVRCSDGELATPVRVLVRVLDLNDHAPAFTQRYYDFRVPAPHARDMPQDDGAEESSTEWEGEGEGEGEGDADDEDDGSGVRVTWDVSDDDDNSETYVATVLAVDPDAGENGTVLYSARARGAARGLLRVQRHTGRLRAHPRLNLRPPHAYDLTVRACDGGSRSRCSVARVVVRGVKSGGGSAPKLVAPAPLQAAELDPPGFLLAVLQATDPDGDTIYYDIVGGDPTQQFHVGREDGSLRLARRLRWEQAPAYALNVSASDGLHIVYAIVNVSVINDANEQGVSFPRDSFAVEVSEAARAGEALLALRAVGAGRLLLGILAAKAPASLPLFHLSAAGVLELAAPLDRERAEFHELTVWVRDQAPRAARAYARVTVRVHDADEHAPHWGRRLAEARLPRGAAPGTLVAALRAADRDAAAPPLAYELAGGGAGLFTVDSARGDVLLARALPPPPAPAEYTLTVRAAPATPAHAAPAATLPLHVLIVDPDDSPPRFTAQDVVCEVYENEPAGTVLAALEARSPTSVTYELHGGRGLFSLNPAAGLLATAAPLDYERDSLYNLTVVASNMGGGTSTAQVVVHVLDRNEFAPRLKQSQYHGRISEAAVAGAAVLSGGAPLVLAADDGDSPANRQRTYDVLEPAAARLFRVDRITGALLLAAPLDYETAAKHIFTVRVLDAGSPRIPSDSTAQVTVEVEDVNDCPPEFEKTVYEATVLTPTANGVLVARISARDRDSAVLKYDIIEGDDIGAFALAPDGALTVARPDALAPSHRLRVRASDGLNSATARVDVRVRAIDNSGLAFQKTDYYGSVVENSTKPTLIVVLNVLGAALNEHVEFHILNPTEGFEVGLTSGAVRSTGLALDREQRASYELALEARAGSRAARARLHISVSDVNDNCPVFVGRPYRAAVRAGAEPGQSVLTVRAHDSDANDNGEVRYEMKRGHGELFRVDRRTGQISLKQTLDAHSQSYSLVIAAFDGGVPACGSEAEVLVRVWAGGAAPAWPQPHYELTVREDAPPARPLAPPLQARSPLNRQLIYTLVGGADANDLFEIQFDTGAVAARVELDYETATIHELVVRATDGVTGAHADVGVTVRVLDVNDCAPELEQDVYRANVSEAAPLGQLVLTVRATDNDTGVNGAVTYSLGGYGAEPTPTEFSVDEAGAIRVATALDRERRAAYHLLLTATDGGRPPLLTTAHLFITVLDANDNPPVMERSVVTALVSAEAARGVALARVAAWDADADDELSFALAGGSLARAFAVDARSGVLTLANTRAWVATGAARSLNVSVADGAHAAFARVKLALAPANRAPPRFPHLVHEARAREEQPPPLLLTTVKAYDDDPGEYGTITYSIPSSKLRETFAVDAASGALTARVALDRETRAEWDVPVAAADGGGLLRYTTVRVRVSDINDHAPVFPHADYRAAPHHARAPGAPFITVSALDADAGDNARITYELHEPDPEDETVGLFTIDPHTGALAFAKNATTFASRALQVWVRAVDGGGRAASAPVSVWVCAGGESPPARAPPPDVYVREDAARGTLLAELRAADGPLPRFRLAPGLWPRDLFAVDADGRLVLAGQLDRETKAEHIIGIIAEGSGSPAPARMLQTTLHVLDVNEHAPVFHSQPYVVHLAENAPPHTSVVQLMAEDLDAGANGEVRFELAAGVEGEEPLFAVDALSGWVTTLGPLDRETRAEHRVAILATDGAPPAARRSARGTLVVRLLDYNDCPPVFLQEDYHAEVSEDAAAGTVVARLGVRDDDAEGAGGASGALSYFVAEGDTRARFGVRPSGELYVARALDREHTAAYMLRVAATDGKFTAYTRVHVTVLDVDDNPPYCVRHRYSARLPEDAARGTRVATLLTADDDQPTTPALRYFLTGDGADHFDIDKETGEITVAAELDRETRATYALQAHAQARGRPAPAWGCASEVLLALDDVNDNAPRFSADTYRVTLPEDADVGTLVSKVHATDADLGENRLVRYSFVEASDAFELAADSGIITLRAPLDRETQAEHRLVVAAADSGRPPRSATATVRLAVADVNDNPPEFEFRAYRAAVSELAAPGAELLRIRATSRDTGVNADVHYELVAGDGRDDFSLDRASGVLQLVRPLDYERRRQYSLTAQATDGGTPPLSDRTVITVDVVDGNDNDPVFSQAAYGARVREDATVGARVLQVLADDADDGDNGRLSYAIARGDRDGRFSIDADTGYISLAAPLDRETEPAYVLEVRARDRGTPAREAAALVNVEVLDANDNPPLFARAQYSALVREDRPLGHTILKFDVTDADASPNAAPYTFDFLAGNEMGAFRLEQDGYLRTATRFNHRIKDRYELQVRVFDNGTPPLFSDATVHVRVVEESQYPPAVTPLEVVINSYLDEFPGGLIGRVIASDRDADDTLAYALAPADGAPYPPTDLFEIDRDDGTLRAAPRLDVGDYRLNVTVDDGKFVSFAIVRVAVVLVSDEMLAQAVVVRFREVTDRDFVLSHRKGFLRAVAEAADCEPGAVVIVSVQPAGEGGDTEGASGGRVRRQVAADLDVAFAVRAVSGGFVAAETLRRRLHAHVERLEERARLVVEELLRAACGGCVHGACAERVHLSSGARVVAADVFALVAPPHRLRGECACAAGFTGERCEREGVAEAEAEAVRVLQLAGDGYLVYRVERGAVEGARWPDDELTLSLRFRTRRPRGTLLAVTGRVDYAVLEVIDGFLQFRMELGSGPAVARAAAPVADGAWHEARLERRGANLRLTLDRRSAHAHAPPPAAVLDVRADRLLLGADLQRHAHALAPEQVTYGFEGCLADVRLGGSVLPLEEGGASEDGRAVLVRRVRARVAPACAALPEPAACASYPCLHGGSCREDGDAFTCTCHARYTGARCEVDTDPCASQPCLHGGFCSSADGGFRCACAAGLAGARCERGRWCGAGVCAHGGACEEGDWGPTCRCRGYYGPRCQYDVDECAGEPCLNGATCLNEPGSFRCLCPPDKTGMNCGNPLYSDAVVAGGAGEGRALAELWRWALDARWPLALLAGAALLLLLVALVLPLLLRRRRPRPVVKPPPPRASKLSNLEAVAGRRERPASCADPPPLNNVDTLRSYGSAGDELEGIPPDYRRNLNIDPAHDRKPWSEQMHLHTFVDNKIYNDLKGCKTRARTRSPGALRRTMPTVPPPNSIPGVGGDMGPPSYHWDCSDWCGGGALPGISEVPGSERPDSSSPPPPSPPAARDSSTRSLDESRFDASSYLLHPDEYLPHPEDCDTRASDSEPLRARTLREPDAASLITMLEERDSLLGGGDAGSCSDLSTNLCEIEESEAEADAEEVRPRARHTEV